MTASPEFMTNNLLDDATLTHSSEETSLPAENIQSAFRTKVWRSDSGWNITAGVNDKIDITEGVTGDATATLTAGNYSTGALMATEVQTQLNAAATDNTWTCTYDTGTRKFTIGHDNVQTGGLEWSTGANASTSAGEDLGYDTSADDTGAASYVGDDETRCSREWIGIDLAAATQCKRLAIVSHNFSSSATVTLYRHTADSLSAATSVGAVTYDADFMVLTFDATYRYWWIHVDDIDNSDGYIEIGRAFLGDFDVLTKALSSRNLNFGEMDPSVPVFTPEGVVGKNERSHYFRATIELRNMTSTDRDLLLTIFGRVGAYKHMFVRLDPDESTFSRAELGGMYGYFVSQMEFAGVWTASIHYTSQLTIQEAL